MLKEEFEKITSVYPTPDEYEIIEQEYYEFNGDKFQFCKDWMNRGEDKKLYQKRVNKIMSLEQELNDTKKSYDTKVNELEKKLEKSMVWEICKNMGTFMVQQDYLTLHSSCSESDILSDDAAKNIISKEFGFNGDQIEIISHVDVFEANQFHLVRVKESYDRTPCYFASDWNYIRFNCAGWQYEMINGELYKYYS